MLVKLTQAGQSRWSKSAPSLEKSPRNPPSSVPTVTSVPELGKNFDDWTQAPTFNYVAIFVCVCLLENFALILKIRFA